jgi:Flp pilus assembly protein TadD
MFEKAQATLPENAQLEMDLAFACAQLGDMECSIQAYERGKALGGRPQPALQELMAVLRPE